MGPQKWKNRNLEDILSKERIIDFDPEDEMTLRYLEKFNLRTAARKDRIFVNNMESLTEMIEAGAGYGVVAEEFLEHFKTKVSPLNRGKPLAHQMAACWYHRPVMSDYFSAIIKALIK